MVFELVRRTEGIERRIAGMCMAACSALLAVALLVGSALIAPTRAYAADGSASASAQVPAATSGADDASLKTLRIGFPSAGKNWYNGLLSEADYQGYLNEYLKPLGYKAEVTGFTGAAPALHEALAAGDLDLVDYAGFAGILGKSKGIDTTVLAVSGYNSSWRLIASTKSGIKSLKDLKGKKIGYTRGATPQMYLMKLLQEAGLSFDDVEPVNVTGGDGVTSVATGNLDASVVLAGQEQKLVDEGTATVIHKGAEADQATFYEPSVLIARTEFAKQNPKVIVAVLKAYLKARSKMIDDPQAFFELSAEQSGNPLNVVEATAAKDPSVNWPASLSSDLVKSLENVQDFELQNKITTAKVDVASWIDPSYLKEAWTEYGSDGKGTDGEQLAAEAIAGAVSDTGQAQAQAEAPAAKLLTPANLALIAVVAAITAAIAVARRQVRARADAGAKTVRVADALFALILPLWVVLVWHLVTATGALSTVVLPTLSSVGSTLVQQLTTGTFKGDLAISISRILKGYALAVVLGVFFGVVMGMSLSANKFFSLTFQAIRQIPMMAWVPLLVIWFGIGEESKVAVIFMASFFPILINTIDGIQRTDQHLVEVGRMYRLSPWRMFREIYLPSALPSIFVGLKLALGISWMAVVGAEMIAASSGIGFRINDDRVLMDYASVFAGMIVIAVAGVLMDAVLTVIARIATPWRQIKQQ